MKGLKIDPGNLLKRHLKKIAMKVGISTIGWHLFRHSFASHLVMKGADIVTLKELLGHSDLKTTLLYSHFSQPHIERTVGLLNFGTEPKDASAWQKYGTPSPNDDKKTT